MEHRQVSILIVDDTPTVSKTLGEIIKIKNPDVLITYAVNGAIAWETINLPGNRFDLLLSDIDMPIMNGIKLAEKVRRYCPGIHVVLMSGNAEPKEHDAHVFLAKPIPMSDLLSTIKRFTEKPQA